MQGKRRNQPGIPFLRASWSSCSAQLGVQDKWNSLPIWNQSVEKESQKSHVVDHPPLLQHSPEWFGTRYIWLSQKKVTHQSFQQGNN